MKALAALCVRLGKQDVKNPRLNDERHDYAAAGYRPRDPTPVLAGGLQGELFHLDLVVVEHAKTERACDLDMFDLAVQELAGIVGLR